MICYKFLSVKLVVNQPAVYNHIMWDHFVKLYYNLFQNIYYITSTFQILKYFYLKQHFFFCFEFFFSKIFPKLVSKLFAFKMKEKKRISLG